MTDRNAIIISASSDIGDAMARRWLQSGWHVCGTYRTESDATRALARQGVKLFRCDMSQADSIDSACQAMRGECPPWDLLVMCPGTLSPVGRFADGEFDAWEASIRVNFTATLRVVHAL